MKLVICVVGGSFPPSFLTDWTRSVSALGGNGHEIMVRIPPDSLRTEEAMLRWAFGKAEKPFGADEYDVALVVNSSILPRADELTALLASPGEFTSALYTNEAGTAMDALVEWDEERVGVPDSRFKAIESVPEADIKDDAGRYTPVTCCTLCLAALTSAAVARVFAHKEDPFTKGVENAHGSFRLDPAVAFVRNAVEAGVAVTVDQACKAVRRTSGLTRP